MRAITCYSISDPDRGDGRARLMREGRALEISVDGLLLEAQFGLTDGCSLIWLTDDSPYDETLHVYLLGADGSVEDALQAGAAFTPGVLKVLDSGEDWIDFEFFQDRTTYRLEVAQAARLGLSLPADWRYKRRLQLHRLSVVTRREGDA